MDRDLICGWLKLPLGNWPPGPFTLLGLEQGEADLETIEARAQERMGWLRPHQLAYSEEVTEGMNRLAQALVCLTGSIPCKNPEKARKSHRKRLPPPIRASRPKKPAAVVNPSMEQSSPLLDFPALGPLMGGGEMPVVWSPHHQPSRGMRLWLASLGGVGVLALAILLLPIPDPKEIIGRPPTKASPVEMLREVRGYTGFPGWVTGMAFAPDGYRFLFAGSDDTIHLWDPQAGKEIQVFPGHTGAVTCLSFSVDGRLLLSGSEDATVRAWSMGDQAYPMRFDGHTASVTAVALSPDGKQILSCGKDNTLRTWDRAGGKAVARSRTRVYSCFLLSGWALAPCQRRGRPQAFRCTDWEPAVLAKWFGRDNSRRPVIESPTGPVRESKWNPPVLGRGKWAGERPFHGTARVGNLFGIFPERSAGLVR